MKNKKDIFVAVDLGGSKLSVMAAEKDTEGTLRILGVESILMPHESIQYGIIRKANVVVSNLKVLLEKIQKNIQQRQDTACEIKSCYIGIDGNTLRTELHTLQKNFSKKIMFNNEMLDDILRQTKLKLAEKGCFSTEKLPQDSDTGFFVYEVFPKSFSLDNIICENPLGKMCSSLKMNCVMARSNLSLFFGINAVTKELDKIRFVKSLAGISLGSAFLTDEEKKNGAVLIDFGAQCTTVIAYQKGVVCYLGNVPLGGDAITKDLMELTHADRTEAENIKRQKGDLFYDNREESVESNNGRIPVRKVVSVIRARQMEIVNFVEQHLEHAECSELLKRVVVITGGASKMKNLDVMLQKEKAWNVKHVALGDFVVSQTSNDYSRPENALLLSLLINASESCCGSTEREKKTKKEKPSGGSSILDIFSGGSILGTITDMFTDPE